MFERTLFRILILLAVIVLSGGTALAACDLLATVDSSGNSNLQTQINGAISGQTICLDQGSTHRGNFVLKGGKTGNKYITITTKNIDNLVAPNTRVKPGFNLARIVSSNTTPAIKTDETTAAQYYRLVGIEVHAAAGIATDLLVRLGKNNEPDPNKVPHHIELDRMYIHGDLTLGGKRGVEVNGRQLVIKNSHLSGFGSDSRETQAIAGINGTRDLLILNNYVEAAGVNIMFGGAIPALKDSEGIHVLPENIAILYNHIAKPKEWQTARNRWEVKNLFESKLARNVVIEGNVFDYNWISGLAKDQRQDGQAIVLKAIPHDSSNAKVCPVTNAVTENVLFRYNLVRHTGAAVAIRAREDRCEVNGVRTLIGEVRHVKFEHNLFDDVDPNTWGAQKADPPGGTGEAQLFRLLMGPSYLTINHNTLIQKSTPKRSIHFEGSTLFKPTAAAFKFTNNILHHAQGVSSLSTWTTDPFFKRNILVNGAEFNYSGNCTGSGITNCYPGTYPIGADYRVNSAYKEKGIDPFTKAPDGKDLGASIDAIEHETDGVMVSAVAAKDIDTEALIDRLSRWVHWKLHGVETFEADRSWQTAGPAGNLEGQPFADVGSAWETVNPGWNSSFNFTPSNPADWKSAIFNAEKHPPRLDLKFIWCNDPTDDAMNGDTPAYFRKKFWLNDKIKMARMTVLTDDDSKVYVNGILVDDDSQGSGSRTTKVRPNVDVTSALKSGENLVATKSHDSWGDYEGLYVLLRAGAQELVNGNVGVGKGTAGTPKWNGREVGCPDGYNETQSVNVTLKNNGTQPLSHILFEITELTGNNLLLTSAGLMGEGDVFGVPKLGSYADGELASSESVKFPLTFCLASRNAYRFFVNVLAVK
jgi:hypothetical protein